MDQHLDAERLAAFADGTLTRAERAALEAHAADCADCLQLLAAMARTEPPLARAGWRLPAWRWAVPIAAAATAVALWINVAPRRATDDAQAPTPAPTSEAQSAEKSAAAPPATPPPTESRDRIDRKRDAPPPAPLAKAAPARAGRGSERDAFADKPQALAEETLARKELGAVAQAPPPPPALPSPQPVAELPIATPSAESRPVGADSARVSQLRLSTRQAPLVEVVSSDPLFRWRATGGVIARSTDGGKTWTSSTTIPNVQLSAGAAPAPATAWLVGAAGVVLLTVDGTEWRRVAFPEAVDLISVSATSARDAAVTAADGRVFRTSDGGGSWSPQEIEGSPF